MTEPVTSSEVRDLPSLTSLRWYAALMVFLLHVHAKPHFVWDPLGPFGVGYVGVTFFFILSGFVLTWSAPKAVQAGRFYRRRFARIYPSHLACMGVAAVGGLVSVQIARNDALSGIFNLGLLHAWWPGFRMVETWNGVSWSLSCEAFFYLCFPFIVNKFRRSPALAPMVLAAVAAAFVATVLLRWHFGIQGAATAYYNPVIRLPEFLLGIWLAVRLQADRHRVRVPLWLAVAFVLISAIAAWRELLPYYPLADYATLPSFAVLIAVAAEHDAHGRDGTIERFLRHPRSQYLGKVSFSFYLIHNLVIPAVMLAGGWFRPWSTLGGALPTAVTFALSFVAAVALHHLVEVPARQWLLPSHRPTSKSHAA